MKSIELFRGGGKRKLVAKPKTKSKAKTESRVGEDPNIGSVNRNGVRSIRVADVNKFMIKSD